MQWKAQETFWTVEQKERDETEEMCRINAEVSVFDGRHFRMRKLKKQNKGGERVDRRPIERR